MQGLGGFSAAIAVWRGVNPTTPFDVADVTGNAAAATKWVPPAITTLTPGAWVVSVVGTSDNNAIEIDTAQGFTARMQGGSYDSGSGGGMAVGLADKLQATAGTPTMLRWEEGSNDPDPWSGITFALRPIVNAAPSVSLTSPANNATFTAPASIVLTADAQDTDGTVTQVEFFQGTTLVATDAAAPFTFTLTNIAVGSYSFTARATDNQGAATTSAPVTVTVAVNALPTVSLTSPANNAVFTAPASIVLTADAQDSDGAVAQVEFFQGTTLVATVMSPPYTFTLNDVAAGGYSFTARSTDNLGASTTSAAVNVTVNTGVAQMYFIHTDHLNTPRLITNQAAQVVWRWDQTDPFGGNVPDENPSGLGNFTCNLRLPGQYFDKETNTHYNYFRDYDPAIGRFVQSDPIGLAGGLNMYAYVDNDPVRKADPRGLIPPGADPDCFRRGECKCATPECAAGIPPNRGGRELCCKPEFVTECLPGTPGTVAECRACAAAPFPQSPACLLCGIDLIQLAACARKYCQSVPRGTCQQGSGVCPTNVASAP